METTTREGQLELWRKRLAFYRQLGYTYLPVEYAPKFAQIHKLLTDDTAVYTKGKRDWVDEHSGVIQTFADLENPDYWPEINAAFDYDLFDDVGIDAKHSFEDTIMPVTEAKQKWGERVAILGGIDVDFLCRSTPAGIKEHTKRVMEVCSKGGGYAVGSGNTIANYIPVENYLAMVEAAREFNEAG